MFSKPAWDRAINCNVPVSALHNAHQRFQRPKISAFQATSAWSGLVGWAWFLEATNCPNCHLLRAGGEAAALAHGVHELLEVLWRPGESISSLAWGLMVAAHS